MQEVSIKPVLWIHKTSSNGEFEVRIRITQYKEVIYLNTGYTCTPDKWDTTNECPTPAHTKFKTIMKRINEMTGEIEFEIKSMQKNWY
jgi:integrase/recombinase XerD